jgi:hypothetical protein
VETLFLCEENMIRNMMEPGTWKGSPTGILLAVLLLLIYPAAAGGHPVFETKDCTCTGAGLPPFSNAFLREEPESGHFALFCEYGGYPDIQTAKGKAARFEIHWQSAEATKGKNADKQKSILNYVEGVKNDRSRHLIEYTPPSSEYISLLYSAPAATRSATFFYGQRAIIYESMYNLFIDGIGYDLSEGELTSLMDSAESCAKAIADAKENAIPASPEPAETKKAFGFDTACAMLACAAGIGMHGIRRW